MHTHKKNVYIEKQNIPATYLTTLTNQQQIKYWTKKKRDEATRHRFISHLNEKHETTSGFGDCGQSPSAAERRRGPNDKDQATPSSLRERKAAADNGNDKDGEARRQTDVRPERPFR